MARIGPLGSAEGAARTLAHRLTRRADRLRQLNTRFGLRSRRVFLVWTRWTGVERGEGDEQEVERVELLPTPRVSDLTAIGRSPTPYGMWPDGTLRVDQISCGAYTEDNLRGLRVPARTAAAPRASSGTLVAPGTELDPKTDTRVDFFYELVDDGREQAVSGDPQAGRKRFRLLGSPHRAEGSLYWSLNIQRASDDRDRAGESRESDHDTFEEG